MEKLFLVFDVIGAVNDEGYVDDERLVSLGVTLDNGAAVRIMYDYIDTLDDIAADPESSLSCSMSGVTKVFCYRQRGFVHNLVFKIVTPNELAITM